MRIGLVCPYSLSVPGGVQEQVLGLARALRSLGYEARVLAPCDDTPPEPFVIPLGRSIPTATNGSVAPLAPDPSCARRTVAALRRERFDVLHLHEPLAPGPTLTSLITSRAPIVGTFHAAGNNTPYRLLHPAVHLVAKRIDLRCAVSPDARDLAERFLGGTYVMMFNGIEIERFSHAVPKPRSAPTVLFLGRHEPRKGLEVLLKAFGMMPPGTQLWVAGSGDQTPELRAVADASPGGDRISWLGRVTDVERASLFAGTSVYCAPNLGGESFGVILLEAMAAGAPIVASDLEAFARVARRDSEALLVPPGDPVALAAAVTAVLADPVLAARLTEAGRERAEEFSMRTLAEKYLGLYAQVIERRRRLL